MKTRRYLAATNGRFRLNDIDPADHADIGSKQEATALLAHGVERLRDLQERLYANDRWGLLLILQAMDAAGKDGAIAHVMSGVNPEGCQVSTFKRPSDEDLDHDFLWRAARVLPNRGNIGIFNRSYYEEVLIVRVHKEILQREKVPSPLVTRRIWQERFEDINGFERHLSRNGYVIRKVFLHLSREEQRQRFLARLEDPTKLWKFSDADVQERKYWNQYMAAYQDAIRHTSTPHAPWYVVPADHKWFARLLIAEIVVEALQSLKLSYPTVERSRRKALMALRKDLLK